LQQKRGQKDKTTIRQQIFWLLKFFHIPLGIGALKRNVFFFESAFTKSLVDLKRKIFVFLFGFSLCSLLPSVFFI